jgi:hypothetical protein
MSREKLEARLIQAEKRVALGQKHIARQREFILGLERLDNDASTARALLAQFEELQATLVERRNGILKEFDMLPARRMDR